ncbi:MAG: EFR1 family ferrodoxin [Oscillospiraceae bacterium]|nr:EFR1 family ferrodoxin [Oscillospiraceae bacterium]
MKCRIYYFTGTGNSLRAAQKIAEAFDNAELVSMRLDPRDVPADDCDVIGFVYPVYHWTMPAPAVQFIKKLSINTKAYIFAVANPSAICGFAVERAAALIKEKGGRLAYGNMINCVANYAIVYPPVPPAKLMVPLMERKAEKIAEDIANLRERAYPRAGMLVRIKHERFMKPYLKLQKYADYPFTVSDDCIGCGICSKVCPCNNISIRDGRPVFLHHCANCMACVTSCPKRAIGYDIYSGGRELLNASGKDTPITKLMGLPAKRKLYRNPYITVQQLTKSIISTGDDNNGKKSGA